MTIYAADIYRRKQYSPMCRLRGRSTTTGVYDIEELGDEGKMRPYKLAVYKDDDYWAFLRLDQSYAEVWVNASC